MPRDFYADVRELATALRACGHDEWADRIIDDIEYSFTGGEILMRLRFRLRELAQSDATLPDTLRQEMTRLLDAIAAVMPEHPHPDRAPRRRDDSQE